VCCPTTTRKHVRREQRARVIRVNPKTRSSGSSLFVITC
jgi:hypothetical protein